MKKKTRNRRAPAACPARARAVPARARCAPGTRPAQGRRLERVNQYRCPEGPEVSVLVRLHLNGRQRRWRPYRVECTGSLPTSEVKRRRARLVLGWGTAREDLRVLPAFHG